jgi:hypothetical protein
MNILLNNINTTNYVQSLSSYKLGCLLRPALNDGISISTKLLNSIKKELKARNSYESELSRRLPH